MCSNESPSTSYHPIGSVTGQSGDSTSPTSVATGPHSGSGSGSGSGGGSGSGSGSGIIYETIQQSQIVSGNNNNNNNNNNRQTPSPVITTASTTASTTPTTTAAAAAAGMSAAMLTAASVSSGLLPPLDHYRLQLYNYAMAERLRCTQYPGPLQLCPSYPGGVNGPYGPRLALSMSLFHNRVFQPEEPKPQHSYIGLIAMAILSSPETKLVLSDIYQHILDNYPYFRSRGPGWRNSIRHNLSLNDCFVKAGRSANGKGHYWAIHPANLEDFKKGDFRRRKAQRKVRKHMGLAVDDEGTDSPSPPPLAVSPPPSLCTAAWGTSRSSSSSTVTMYSHSRKRQFDVASLLAPDVDDTNAALFKGPTSKRLALTAAAHCSDLEEDIDVVTSDQEDHGDDQLIDRSSPLISISPIMDEDQINRPHSNSSQHHYNHNHHHHHHHHHNVNHHHHPQAMAAAAAAAAAASTATATWQGLMQQWPSGFTPLTVGMDPRILGRYYGHYMAAHAAHANRRSAALHGPPADITEIITTTSSTGQTLQSNDC